MTKFYFTFMFKQAFKNLYVEIIAGNEALARNAMHEHFGDKWMTNYTWEQFEPQIDRFGLTKLCSITAIDHGSSQEFILGEINEQ